MVQECIAPDLAAVLGPAFGEVPGPGVRFALNPPVDAVSAAVGNAALSAGVAEAEWRRSDRVGEERLKG